MEIWDKHFVTSKAFPKEKNYVAFDHLTYAQTVLVKKKDSFELFQSPLVAETKLNATSPALAKAQFTYDTLKLTVKSMFKLASANTNEQTQTLKLLFQENAMKRSIDKKLEMIGIDKILSLGLPSTQDDKSEVSEPGNNN